MGNDNERKKVLATIEKRYGKFAGSYISLYFCIVIIKI